TGTAAMTPLVAVFITDTVLLPARVTYTRVPDGLIARNCVPGPISISPASLPVAVSSTSTNDPSAIYTRVPEGLTATPRSDDANLVVGVDTTVLVVVSITVNLPGLESLVTYARVPAGLSATPIGEGETGIIATTVLAAVS